MTIATSFKVKNDWSRNGGFKGEIALINKGKESKDWTLEFEADFEITKIWNAQIVSHVGNRYVIKSGRWNKNLSKGETTNFGFNARVDNRKITKPSNYKVNQQPLDVTPPSLGNASPPKNNPQNNNPLIDTSFKVKDDWSRNGGFKGQIDLTNKGNESKDWTLEFEADFEITKIWNAQIVSHVGDSYVIKSGRWNNNLDKGETTHFGFNALVDNRTIIKPSNYTFNQQPLKGFSPQNDDPPVLKSNPSPKLPKIVPPSNLSPQAITVGFEQHNAGTKYTRAVQNKDWNVDWVDTKLMDNHAFITNKEAHSGNKSLSISYSPNKRTGAGAALHLPDSKQYFLSYWVKFEDDFSFNGSKQGGGKLPGLAGAGGYCSGGQDCNGNNGFSARYMWGRDGKARLYLYHMDKPSKYGENFDFKDESGKDVYFERGKWQNLIQRVKINDGNQHNGKIDVWKDGKKVLDLDRLQFVNNNKSIDGMLFSSFHGGLGSQWLPDHQQNSFFDDIRVSTNASDVGLSDADL